MYQWDSKILDIIWTIASRIFVLWFILMVLLSFEHIISHRYKINPWIIVSLLVVIFWLGLYFSLTTKTTYLNIETDKINKDVKILLVSDIHAENITQDFHVKKIIDTIKEEKPDFTIIAWDLMNKPNEWYVNYFSGFSALENSPILAVVWNHDVMFNTEVVKKIPGISNIKFLNNESIEVNWVQILWIIDSSIWNGQSLENIMDQIQIDPENNKFSILVSHHPISLEKLKDYPIDLEVAWHTHRWQFYWMRKIVEWMNDYAYWEYKLWDRTAFVTQWIWTWGLPFRLWTQSEMVIINLKKK